MAFDTRWAPWKQQFSFNSTQSGDITDWAESTVANPSASYGITQVISAKGFVYQFRPSTPNNCYRAVVGSGGSLGSWTTVSTGLHATNLVGMEFLWAGDRLYILGGLDYTSGHAVSSTAVSYADINTDGSIGSWTAAASLPSGRSVGCVVALPSRLYYIGGQQIRYTTEFTVFVYDSKSEVYYVDLDTDGIITGSWSTSANALPDLRGNAGVALAGSTIYILGGDKNSTKQSSIYTATVSGSTISSWSTSGYGLPAAMTGPSTCVTEDTLYVIGGIGGSNEVYATVMYGTLDTSGALTGSLSYGTDLSSGDERSICDILVTSTKIYLLGGHSSTGLENYAVEATFAGGLDDYTLTPEDVDLSPTLVTNSPTFYSATLEFELLPTLVTNDQTFPSFTVSPGNVYLTPGYRTGSAQTVFTPAVTRGAVSRTPTLVTNSQTFPTFTVSPGNVYLTPGWRTGNSQGIYLPTVTRDAVELSPELLTNSQTLYAPTASPGDVSLSPDSRTSNVSTLYAPVVAPQAVDLTPTLVTNTSTIFVPEVPVGDAMLTQGLITNGQTFYSSSIEVGDVSVTVPLLGNESTVFAPTIYTGALSLTVHILANEQEFFPATAEPGAVDVSPPLLESGQEFFGGDIYQGALALSVPLVVSFQEFFPSEVYIGALVLEVPFIDSLTSIFAPTVANVGALLPEVLTGSLMGGVWGVVLDPAWDGVVREEGVTGSVEENLWSGAQVDTSWSTEIAPDWAGTTQTQ